jgi:hypothetical protein
MAITPLSAIHYIGLGFLLGIFLAMALIQRRLLRPRVRLNPEVTLV